MKTLRSFLWWSITACVAGMLALAYSNVQAQTWRQIGNLPAATDLRCAYFWDVNHGVVGGVNCIYTYINGVWSQAAYPEAPDTIKSLRLLDGVNLYAASGSTCVWKSVDHGATWQKTNALLPKADDIFMTIDGQIQGMNLNGTGMMRGTSFARLAGFDCAAARDDDNSMAYSTDSAVSWLAAYPPNLDCGYNCVVDTCSGMMYTLSDGAKAVLYVSSNGGASWVQINDFENTAHDILEGANDGVLYVQGLSDVFRITTGQTWINIDGPASLLEDRRMFAFGTYNRYLIDMVGGAVWLFDGGPDYPGTHLSETALITPPGCGAYYTELQIQWDGPEDTMVVHAFSKDSAQITPADTTLVLSPNGNYSILYYTPFPSGTSRETFYFNDTAWRMRCPAVTHVFDTSFTVTVRPQQPSLKFPDTLKQPYCLTAKLPLVITPASCDSLWIDSIICSAPVGVYTVLGTLPEYIAGGSRDTFFLFVQDLAPGTYALAVEIIGSSLSTGGRYDTTLTMALVIAGNGTPSSISFTPTVKKLSCIPARMPIVIKTSICDSIWIDSVRFSDDTSQTYALQETAPVLIPPASIDTVWIVLSQGVPGHYGTYLDLFGHSTIPDSWLDTSLTILTDVVPNPKTPRVITKSFTASNCKQSAIFITLDALPCDSVQFTYAKISVSGGAQYTNSFSVPTTVSVGSSDTVWLSFPPQGLSGVSIVTAEFRGLYSGTSLVFDTTVYVRVTFTNSGHAIVTQPNLVQLAAFSFCDSTDTVALIQNIGCDTIILTSDGTHWLPGWRGTYPSLPDTLQPDSSCTVHVRFQPMDTISQTQNVTFSYHSGAIVGTADFTVMGEAFSVPARMALDRVALDFDTFERCHTMMADSTITVTNTSCDSLHLSNIAVDAGSGFTLTAGDDTILARNESATFHIHFADSIVGQYASLFHCIGTNVHGGSTVDTAVPLSATIVSGTRSASIAPVSIDFGATTLCEERDSFVTIINTGCEADTLYGFHISGQAFALDTILAFPIVLLPNTSANYRLITDLDTTGHPNVDTGTLSFQMDSGSQVAKVSLQRGILYPARFSLWLSATPQSIAGAMDTVFVHRTGTIPNAVQEVDFDLIYNDDLLGYQTKLERDIAMIASTRLPNGMTDRTFSFRPAMDRDTIAMLQFQTYLTKNETTPIALANQSFTVSGADAAACIAAIDTGSIPAQFQRQLTCGDSTILAAWNETLPFRVDAIVPNPATNTIAVSGEGLSEAGMNITLWDLLGTRMTIPQPSLLSGLVTFDLSSVSAGSYYLRLSNNGYTVTRKVRIER
ncbi:MAG TPA: T9SS type A sorting domain-containing protein [Candidatus Kapabacteria bacterium]|jgi:hypothetical protein